MDHIESLTRREHEIIVLFAEGLNNKQIGTRLSMSEEMVRHNLRSIYRKLNVADRFELMIFAYVYGLAEPPVGGCSVV